MNNLPRNLDPYCDYRMFKSRVDGQIACLAVGNGTIQTDADNSGEITGIAFQKVDEGLVKPVIESNNFTEVRWKNAHTQNGYFNYFDLDDPIFPPKKTWHEFANVMLHLHQALIGQMLQANSQAPATLYDGLHSNLWIGGINNSRKATSDFNQTRDIRQAMGQHWVNDEWLLEMVVSVLKGFSDGRDKIGTLLSKLLNIFVFEENFTRRIKQAPTETSDNKSLEDGVVHCLFYGYHPNQPEMEHPGQPQEQGRLHHRVLLRTSLEHRSMSSSRSPSPESRSSSRSPSPVYRSRSRLESSSPVSNLQYQVEGINQNQQNIITVRNMFQYPDDYILLSNTLHSYFEPHKPDFMIYNQHAYGVQVKVLVEVSSYDKYGDETSCSTHLMHSTEQCVKQCLSALSHNQAGITGLVIVPDGFKVIQVTKHNNPDFYSVKETRLFAWNETFKLYAVLYFLEEALEEA